MKKKFYCTLKIKILFIVSIIVLTSCSVLYHKVNCPEFDEEFLCWMPYQENDMIELYSKSIDSTILFLIESVQITHTTHYNTGTDCGSCDDNILIKNNVDNSDNSKFIIDIILRDNKIDNQSYWIGDTYFINGNYTYSELKNYSFEDKEYDIVRIFKKNDTGGNFKKLIIAKDIGIVGLIDIDNNSWVLKTIVNEPIEHKKILINNISCE